MPRVGRHFPARKLPPRFCTTGTHGLIGAPPGRQHARFFRPAVAINDRSVGLTRVRPKCIRGLYGLAVKGRRRTRQPSLDGPAGGAASVPERSLRLANLPRHDACRRREGTRSGGPSTRVTGNTDGRHGNELDDMFLVSARLRWLASAQSFCLERLRGGWHLLARPAQGAAGSQGKTETQ